jgi:hypothetical protein
MYIINNNNNNYNTMPQRQRQRQKQQQQQQQQQTFLVEQKDINHFFLPNTDGSFLQGIRKKYPELSRKEATNTREFVNWLVYKEPKVEDVLGIIDVIHRFPFSGYNLHNLTEHLNREIVLHSYSFTYDWFIPVVERLLVAGATPNDLKINNQKHVIWPTLIDKWDTKRNHQQSLELMRLFLKYGLDLNQPLDGKTVASTLIDRWDIKRNHQQSLEMMRLFLKYGFDLNQPLDGKTAVDYAISIGKYQIAAILEGFFGGKTTETINDILPDVRYLFTPRAEP